MKRITKSNVRTLLLSITASLIIVLALSCQKNDQFLSGDTTAKSGRVETVTAIQEIEAPRADDFIARGGTLYFKDSDAFYRIQTFLSRMSRDERLKFAQTAGFKSLLTYQKEFNKACEAAEEANDESGYKVLLNQYADVVSLDANQILFFKVQSPLLASVIDRNGLVYIGSALYKFGDSEETVVLDGDRAKLNAPESAIVKHISHKPFAAKSERGRQTSSTCPFLDNKYVTGNCGDRQSKLAVIAQTTTTPQGNGQWTTKVTPYALAFSYKKNAFGNWTHYSTGNSMWPHWTFYAYTNEQNQPNGPSNPFVFVTSDTPFTVNDSQIERYGPDATFPNSNNASSGSITYYFEFPNDSGYHRMVCDINNAMFCF